MGYRISAPGLGSAEMHRITDVSDPHGIGLSMWTVERAQVLEVVRETAFVLLGGGVTLASGPVVLEAERGSLWDAKPSSLLVSKGAEVRLRPTRGVAELAVLEAEGGAPFEPQAFGSDRVRTEQRGQGALHDAAHREVRTIVDDRVGPPGARLVLGEVVTFPGRWSSYPPHHHRQPELYHYRFDRASGYGHAELSEDVVKVHDRETVVIDPGETHAQCAAPGYAMWYLWVIRHLDDERYRGPEFDPEHRWALEPGAECWWPSETPA